MVLYSQDLESESSGAEEGEEPTTMAPIRKGTKGDTGDKWSKVVDRIVKVKNRVQDLEGQNKQFKKENGELREEVKGC